MFQNQTTHFPAAGSARPIASQFRESRLALSHEADAKVIFEDFYKSKHFAKITNISQFGARIETDSSDECFSSGTVLRDARIVVQQKELYRGDITMVNEQQLGNSKVALGICIGGSGIDLDRVKALLGLLENKNIAASKRLLSSFSEIRPEFKVLVSDMSTFLHDLKTRMETEEERLKADTRDNEERKKHEEHLIDLAITLYSDDLNEFFGRFQQLTDSFSPDETAIHKNYFQGNFQQSLVNGVPFMNRALTKPLGYAGDYGLMVMFYEYSDMGASLFHKFWHRFSCNSPAAIANKNRVILLSEHLKVHYDNHPESMNGSFKVSTIACGPAKEIELFLRQVEPKDRLPIEVVCVDQDAEALGYAQSRIRKTINSKKLIKPYFFQEDAVLGLIKERDFTQTIEGSQVIISAGLFDYLSDRVSSKLISTLFKKLASGGTMLIGNVADQNPDTFAMNYLMDWNLILRSPADLQALVSEEIRNQPGVKIEVIKEAVGLNLFLIIKKP